MKSITRISILRKIPFLSYAIFTVWITLLNREAPNGTNMLMHPFWEYVDFFKDMSWITAHDIVLNIILFIPYGFLFPVAFYNSKRMTVWAGFFTTVAIELCQLIFQLGWAEIDDIVNNTLGVFIGYKMFVMIERKIVK